MDSNTWTQLATSVEVGHERPHLFEVGGIRLVVFRRGDGTPAVLSDYCVHRGGVISNGWLTEDRSCVVCPYHGWAFDGDGQCRHIPTNLTGVPIPDDIRVDSYPCLERNGTIWVSLGDVEPGSRRPADKDQP